MIIFISDLHISDGTAGPENIPASAYTKALHELGEMARDAEAETVEIVFLGDIFDLIRSAKWQDADVSEDEKPWGANPTSRKLNEILDLIMSHNSIDVLKGDLRHYGFREHPKLTYIPGNHDRVVNLFPDLIAKVEQSMSLQRGADQGKPFPHFFSDARHRTFARHGHEFDYYNFGGSQTFSLSRWVDIPESDYNRTPIGDVIAAEFASALPGAVLKRLGRPDAALEMRLKNLFDLRPMTAIPAYLTAEVAMADEEDVKEAIIQGTKDRVQAFRNLPFVQQWFQERDQWFNPFDKADRLQILMDLLNFLDFDLAKRLTPFVDKVSRFGDDDNLASDAAKEFQRLNSETSPFRGETAEEGMLYVLYGHTHHPEQHLIDVQGDCDNRRPRMYLNTGMWRPSQNAGLAGGFTEMKHLTFTVIYAPGEKINNKGKTLPYPAFEVWTGALKER